MFFVFFLLAGLVVSIVTFPGVIVHELAHVLFCRVARVAVFDVCYFRIGRTAGYVLHEPPPSPGHALLIAIGPLLVNTLLGALIALPAAIPVLRLDTSSPFDYLSLWLGVSIAMHAFPSTEDAKRLWRSVVAGNADYAWKLVAAPLAILSYVGAIGRFFWLDLAYGVAVALFLPALMVRILA